MLGPRKPALHSHSVSTVAPVCSVEVLAGHGLQIDELEDEYSPAGHETQALEVSEPTSVQNEPAGHVIHETDALVSRVNDPGERGIQSRFEVGMFQQGRARRKHSETSDQHWEETF